MKQNNIFSNFIGNVDKMPDKNAVIFDQQQYSYQAVYDLVINDTRSIAPHSHVAVLLENTIEFVVLLLLAAKNNFVLVPFVPNTTEQQLQHLYHRNDVDIQISDQGLKAVKSRANGVKQYDDQYIIVSTSGSTSAPKPIVLTQEIKLKRIDSARLSYGLDQHDVILVSTPMHHSLAQRGVLLALVLGGTAVIMDKFSPAAYLHSIEQHKVSFSFAVSSQLEAISELDWGHITSLKTLVSSSYTLKPETKLSLSEKLHCDIHECYGTSEIGCATNLSPADLLSHPQSVGNALAHVDIKIIDSINGVGEIAVKTTTAFKGYYKMPEQTTQSFIGDYFKTGDLGKIDDGFLYFMGRSKELIKTGGISVYPLDIEKVINQVKGVIECAVIGVEDDYFGEAIVAVVVGEVTKKVLRKACQNGLAPYQHPMYYDIVAQLPKNALGKLQKFKLKAHYKDLQIGRKLRGVL